MLLLPSLLQGSLSRIINVNSIMHYVGFVDTEDMNMASGKRNTQVYGDIQIASWHSNICKRIPAEAGINVLCVSPGIVHTN
ncbi:hypothetical protein ACMD2_25705, partial [Ananas comosus]